jgi:nucleoside 2-deoxyribosyltransferase
MSDLPGTPRRDIDPAVIRDQLEKLTAQVARLMESQQVTEKAPQPASRHPKCFIIMPFGIQDLEDLYNEFILPVLDACKLECARGDDIFGSNVVMEDVKAAISTADLVIADLSGQNPNVFYEVGIAHTLGKPVLLLSQSIEDVPFDLRHRRVLPYEYTPIGCKRLVARLREHVLAMLGLE